MFSHQANTLWKWYPGFCFPLQTHLQCWLELSIAKNLLFVNKETTKSRSAFYQNVKSVFWIKKPRRGFFEISSQFIQGNEFTLTKINWDVAEIQTKIYRFIVKKINVLSNFILPPLTKTVFYDNIMSQPQIIRGAEYGFGWEDDVDRKTLLTWYG